MGTEIVINEAAFANTRPAFAFAGLDATQDNLADGIGQSYGVIGYKGKVWTLRVRGTKHTFVRPDDGTPISYIDVIILSQARTKSKSFYPKYDPSTSDGERPLCASIDGITPDVDVQTKQAEACALCPRNTFKTDPSGRRFRECTDYKRLAVLVLPTLTQKLLGDPLMEPVFLRVPPASLQSLAAMGEAMAKLGYHYATYITRISFDPAQPHPQMQFKAMVGLTDAEAPVILDVRADPLCNRIVGGDQPQGPRQIAAAAPQPPLMTPGSLDTGITTIAPEPIVAPPVAQQVAQHVAIDPSPATIQLAPDVPSELASEPAPTRGLALALGLGVSASPPVKASPTPVQQSLPLQAPADSGAPQEADEALDARLDALLKG